MNLRIILFVIVVVIMGLLVMQLITYAPNNIRRVDSTSVTKQSRFNNLFKNIFNKRNNDKK
jgi:hypothetical protein